MVRRTILLVAVGALVLATFGTPAGAIPKNYYRFDTSRDMDGDLVWDTYTVDAVRMVGASEWTLEPVAVHAPVVSIGGHVSHYDDGVLVLSGDVPVAPGMVSKVTYCKQETTFTLDTGVVRRVDWDPIWLLIPPPAIPPSDG